MCLAQGPQRSDAGEARTRGILLTLNLIEMAFNTFENRANQDQTALLRAA